MHATDVDIDSRLHVTTQSLPYHIRVDTQGPFDTFNSAYSDILSELALIDSAS